MDKIDRCHGMVLNKWFYADNRPRLQQPHNIWVQYKSRTYFLDNVFYFDKVPRNKLISKTVDLCEALERMNRK